MYDEYDIEDEDVEYHDDDIHHHHPHPHHHGGHPHHGGDIQHHHYEDVTDGYAGLEHHPGHGGGSYYVHDLIFRGHHPPARVVRNERDNRFFPGVEPAGIDGISRKLKRFITGHVNSVSFHVQGPPPPKEEREHAHEHEFHSNFEHHEEHVHGEIHGDDDDGDFGDGDHHHGLHEGVEYADHDEFSEVEFP